MNWFLVPPIAFMVVLAVSIVLSLISKQLALKTTVHAEGKFKSYGCGEDIACPRVQPEYREFFPFAFFFTIMHVVVLIIATVPHGTGQVVATAFLYILAALSGLFVLFRK